MKDEALTCDECGITQESGFVNDEGWCMDCEEVAMEIKSRDWHDLSDHERIDGIYATRAWIRGEFALLLPCDISELCKEKFIESATRAEQFSASCKRTLEAMQ